MEAHTNMEGTGIADADRGSREIERENVNVIEATRLGWFRLRLFILCGAITILDGFDTQAMALVAPVISFEWEIGKTMIGAVLTAGVVGLMLGTMIFGPLCDRWGRRPVLIGSTAAFGCFTLLTATASNFEQLLFWRLVTGIGLGGAIVSALSLAAEYAPSRHRGVVVTILYAGFPLGGGLGAAASPYLISPYGWQALFVVGGILPLALLPLLLVRLPESLAFLARGADVSNKQKKIRAIVHSIDPDGDPTPFLKTKAQDEAAARGRVSGLFRDGRATNTIVLWTVCFLNLLAVYLMITWLPTLLQAMAVPLESALRATAVFNLGGVAGGIAMSFIVAAFGPGRVLMAAYVTAAASAGLLSTADNYTVALLLLAIAGASIIGSQFCITALLVTSYPTEIRSTGVGWGLGIGRIGAIGAPMIGGVALSAGFSGDQIVGGLAAPMLACALLVFLLPRGPRP